MCAGVRGEVCKEGESAGERGGSPSEPRREKITLFKNVECRHPRRRASVFLPKCQNKFGFFIFNIHQPKSRHHSLRGSDISEK